MTEHEILISKGWDFHESHPETGEHHNEGFWKHPKSEMVTEIRLKEAMVSHEIWEGFEVVWYV